MKQKVILTLFLLLMTFIQAQKNYGTLIFNDGRKLNGLIKIKGNDIIFKKSEKSERENYNYENISALTFLDKENTTQRFEYIKLDHKNIPKLCYVEINDFLKLYSNVSSSFIMNGMGGNLRSTSTFHIKRENEEFATYYVAFGYIPKNSFKSVVLEYFKDCQHLINKLEKKEFKKKHYFEIIEYYNNNCR
ncbi:hypothetical protein [Flagellimonas marinaquae]|uniref:hypothetical protein n=1 Tax=Flagellimonas marinaquae TaxID=254955 RepID=UPI000F8D0418|nr:hypothetical protein [Allomuricauda aquimarina]